MQPKDSRPTCMPVFPRVPNVNLGDRGGRGRARGRLGGRAGIVGHGSKRRKGQAGSQKTAARRWVHFEIPPLRERFIGFRPSQSWTGISIWDSRVRFSIHPDSILCSRELHRELHFVLREPSWPTQRRGCSPWGKNPKTRKACLSNGFQRREEPVRSAQPFLVGTRAAAGATVDFNRNWVEHLPRPVAAPPDQP